MRSDEFPNIDELVYKEINRVPIIDRYVNQEINRVLDKIRSDIEKLANDEWNTKVGSVSQGLECALEIIEAYQEGR